MTDNGLVNQRTVARFLGAARVLKIAPLRLARTRQRHQ
jgi:hypothetical protein